MKRLVAILLTLSFMFCFAGCNKKETLTLYTWEGMFPDEIIEEFEKETGIEVNYVSFDTDETMLAKLSAAKGGTYDLIIADDYIVEQAIDQNLVQKLDSTKLTNYSNINSDFLGQFYDKTDNHTVPYGAGVMQIVYNPEKVDGEITQFADLFNTSLKGRVGIVGNNRVITGLTLKSLGYSMNSTNPAELKEAGAKLIDLAPNIKLIKDQYINDDLITGEIDVGVFYQSQATLAMLENPNLKAVCPSDAIGYGVMAMFIPSAAPNSDAALKFIDFILDGKNSAKCFEYIGYVSTNKAADEYISEEYKSFLTIPESVDMKNAEIIQNVPQEISDIHEEIWNEFVTKCS